ncbi:MAG TPA: hypothetical protein VGN97_08090 [Mesorhizobium sp.]|jgi:hypothetical protein|nr:hypothetical protein [Mesorhizobium sp.]
MSHEFSPEFVRNGCIGKEQKRIRANVGPMRVQMFRWLIQESLSRSIAGVRTLFASGPEEKQPVPLPCFSIGPHERQSLLGMQRETLG